MTSRLRRHRASRAYTSSSWVGAANGPGWSDWPASAPCPGECRFFDEMPQDRLRLAYSAANVLVLASEREGWPNVLLESAAAGRR